MGAANPWCGKGRPVGEAACRFAADMPNETPFPSVGAIAAGSIPSTLISRKGRGQLAGPCLATVGRCKPAVVPTRFSCLPPRVRFPWAENARKGDNLLDSAEMPIKVTVGKRGIERAPRAL